MPSWLASKNVVLPALFALAVAAHAATPAYADGPAAGPAISAEERDRQAEAIARSVMSPFCPGRTVSSCPNAAPWRADIRQWVGEGVPADEIRRRLAARVPTQDLTGVPQNRLGWLLPSALGVGALGLLVFLLRYLIKPGPPPPPPPGPSAEAKPSPGPRPANGDADKSDVANGDADKSGASKAKPAEDWDSRLEQELDTLEN